MIFMWTGKQKRSISASSGSRGSRPITRSLRGIAMVTKSKKHESMIYMKVSRDKYELPLAVADTADELALIVGTTKNTVLSSISHGHRTYIRVNVEDDE